MKRIADMLGEMKHWVRGGAWMMALVGCSVGIGVLIAGRYRPIEREAARMVLDEPLPDVKVWPVPGDQAMVEIGRAAGVEVVPKGSFSESYEGPFKPPAPREFRGRTLRQALGEVLIYPLARELAVGVRLRIEGERVSGGNDGGSGAGGAGATIKKGQVHPASVPALRGPHVLGYFMRAASGMSGRGLLSRGFALADKPPVAPGGGSRQGGPWPTE